MAHATTATEVIAEKKESLSRKGFRALFLFPFKVSWKLASFAEKSLGLLFLIIVGAACLLAGLALLSTLIGFIFGIPLVWIGVFLLLRALY